ncbi:MAG: phenylalanine--tRNA ligase subunit alpha [Phycisphaerales bacterium]|jgi:phenylalanyl-tRNA synthetase alpha chain|nr:phenylalanine--tRNA ligase subunit alpha [Phycisphaerales bacterium]
MLAELDTIEGEALQALADASDSPAIEAWRIEWLGTKGRLKGLMGRMKDVEPGDRPAFGQRVNALKQSLNAAFEQRQAASSKAASGPPMDVTEPGEPMGLGRRHIISRTIAEILEVFARMGFEPATGPEVEDEWHNFTALNVPEDHPARAPIDNFYLEGGGMLRSQTSTVQIRVLEQTPPPVRIVAAGRVYRPDTHDATHYSMFHQVEGLYVDRGVTLVDLKATLLGFAHAYFGEAAEVRMRPSYFPFTEPSAEVDMKMRIKDRWQWVELGGCGMVDPNVLTAVGVDPEEFTGFAFGLGVERIAMRKYGIADIRWLYENDARFLRQF